MNEYNRWFEKQFTEISGLDKALQKYQQTDKFWMVEALKSFQYRYSSIWRHEKASLMKYICPIKKQEYIITCFKLSSLSDLSDNVCYAMLYSEIKDEKVNHCFVCYSPTFNSADGEFRNNFVPFANMYLTTEADWTYIFPIQELFTKKVDAGELTGYAGTIYPEGTEKYASDLEESIKNQNIAIKLYVLAWMDIMFKIRHKITENHICSAYKNIFNEEENIKLANKLIPEKYTTVPELLNLYAVKKIRMTQSPIGLLTMGQKFIPLSVREINQPMDLRLMPWRELHMNSMASDLVINGITPCLPIMHDWFIIRSSPDLYDNTVSQIKFQHSDDVKQIIKDLQTTKSKFSKTLPEFKTEEEETEMLVQLRSFDLQIDVPMAFAEKEIIKSPFSLCFISEFLGRTMADIPNYFKNSYLAGSLGKGVFTNPNVLKKHLFEFLYTICCLNKHLNIIHGDLHLNNIVMFVNRTVTNYTKDFDIENSYCIYKFNDKEYLLQHYNYYSGIIDFSRALIWNDKLLSKDYNKKQMKEIRKSVKARVVSLIKRTFPEYFSKNLSKFNAAIIDNFNALYRIATAIDSYRLFKNLEILFDREFAQSINKPQETFDVRMISNEIMPLLRGIYKEAHTEMLAQFEILFCKIGTPEIKQHSPTKINEILLEKYFNGFVVNQNPVVGKKIHIVDFHDGDNDLKYSLKNKESYPPTMDLTMIYENKLENEYEKVIGDEKIKAEPDAYSTVVMMEKLQASIPDLETLRLNPVNAPRAKNNMISKEELGKPVFKK